jgi:hypothetical protein
MIQPPQIHFITVATRPHPILDVLLKTFQRKGESLEVLGLELNCEIGQDLPHVRRLGVKLHLIYEFVHRAHLAADDIVVFCDAYDVVFCGDRATVAERFEAMGHAVVFGAELGCYPDGWKAGLYPPAPNAFKFLNSGLFAGRVAALRECMRDYAYTADCIEHEVNDQQWWTDVFLSGKHDMVLDYEHALFLNCVWIDEGKITIDSPESGDVVRIGSATPQFLHGNGPGKDTQQFQRVLERFRCADFTYNK